jgi:hypothetical protein
MIFIKTKKVWEKMIVYILLPMETFISAIQKLVIKEVILYADRKIATTKTVVNK